MIPFVLHESNKCLGHTVTHGRRAAVALGGHEVRIATRDSDRVSPHYDSSLSIHARTTFGSHFETHEPGLLVVSSSQRRTTAATSRTMRNVRNGLDPNPFRRIPHLNLPWKLEYVLW